MLNLASVSVCISGGFPPFSLLLLSKGFSLCHLDCSPSNPLSWPITPWSELQLSGSTICVPVPSWLCPAVPSATMPPAPPSPRPSPPWGRELPWICSGLGLPGSSSAHVLAQHGTGERVNLDREPGSHGESPHCLGGLEPSRVTVWRGAPGQLSSCPTYNQ